MKIQFNGSPIDIEVGSLADLLAAQGLGDAKVATAVNGDFVPLQARTAKTLTDGDMVEVVAPKQGG